MGHRWPYGCIRARGARYLGFSMFPARVNAVFI